MTALSSNLYDKSTVLLPYERTQSLSALLAGVSPDDGSLLGRLTHLLQNAQAARSNDEDAHAVLESIAETLGGLQSDGGDALIRALAENHDAAERIMEMLEHDPKGTRNIFASLSPIEAVRFLRYLDREDPIGSEHILSLVQREDPSLAMSIYAAFGVGGAGGYHNPYYWSGGYNSIDGISLHAPELHPQTYSFFRS